MVTRSPRRLLGALAVVATVVAFGGASAAQAAAPADQVARPGTIRYLGQADSVDNQFIVVLAKDTSAEDTPRITDELIVKYGGTVGFRYTAALQGFSLNASADVAERMATDPAVEYVVQDQTVRLDALGVQGSPPSWGIDRIDERSLPLDNKYHYPNTAQSVRAYIIDTGIRLTHQEFGGRAVCGFDPWAGGCDPCNLGHGTHVAGTVGGRSVGVAKQVRIVSVRVFECSNSTTWAAVIAGVNYVTTAAMFNPNVRHVANMSLGGGAFQPVDDAVTTSIAANVHYSIAAGNNGGLSCNTSPARTPRATTVGATTITDTRAAFSNFGACNDLFAPGVNITSAWHTSDSAYTALQGTSMAAPHAAGVAALWRQKFPADNADAVATALAANATPGVVINPGAGSPNLLLFSNMIPV